MEPIARISGIKRFAVHDGDGIRTTVFLSGCPLRCAWCHNPEGLRNIRRISFNPDKCINCGLCASVCKSGVHSFSSEGHLLQRELCADCGNCDDICPVGALRTYGKLMTVSEVMSTVLEDVAFYKDTGGVTLSGGECLMSPDFCLAVAQECKKQGIGVYIDTCGCVDRSVFKEILPFTDCFLYDVKAYDECLHFLFTGRNNKRILENLKWLSKHNAEIELRVPFVPDLNGKELPAIAAMASGLHIRGVRIIPYHGLEGSKYISLGITSHRTFRVPSADEIEKAKEIFAMAGVNVLS